MVQLVPLPGMTTESLRLVTALQARLPDWRAEVSSPLRYAIELRVQDKIAELGLLNATASQLIVSDADGIDLDQLLANFDMARLPGESDADFRARVPDQWAALSRETEPGLLRRVVELTAAVDASMSRGANYAVTLYVQSAGFNASDAALRTAVQTTMNRADVKPWYSDFTVQAETRTVYTVTGNVMLEPGAVQSVVAPLVQQALDDELLKQRRLNMVPMLSPMIVAVHAVDGVLQVNLSVAPGNILTATAADSTVYVGSRGALTYS